MTKVTDFSPNGIPIALSGWSTGVTSIGSNADSNPPLSALNFVQRITSGATILLNPSINFAAGSNVTLSAASNTITINASSGSTSPLTTKGDLYTFDTANQRLAVGSNGTGLYADSAQATGNRWTNMAITGELLMADGVTAPPVPVETEAQDDWLYADI